MLNKHPGAQLLKTMGDPPVDIRFGNDQYIQCTAVTPEPNRNLPIFTNPDVPLPVRTYYEHRCVPFEFNVFRLLICQNSAINLFSSTRQVKKMTRDGAEEIWLEKTYFTTEEAFPTVLRRSEVVGLEVVEISPLENALNEVETKTKELSALSIKYQALAKTTQMVSTNALAMSLNSAVDAPLHTGIAAYRQIFFGPDYTTRHPERAEAVEKLRSAIDDQVSLPCHAREPFPNSFSLQVRVIDSCLKLHGHLCPPEFIPFHETLEKFFKKNFRDEIRKLAVDGASDTMTISPSLRSHNLPTTSQYQSSMYEQSLKRSMSSSSTARGPFVIPPLQLGRSMMSPQPTTSQSPVSPTNGPAGIKQTPLQRHLAHLARHGINGVSSAPGDAGGSDSLSAESPHNSFVNVGNGVHGSHAAQMSGASVATSTMGSIGSFGSLKGRFSRFGSLNFSRRGNSGS